MFSVKNLNEVFDCLSKAFDTNCIGTETVSMFDALGRTLGIDLIATEYVPSFNRSTVDGYAVRARDTFGSSEAIPALLAIRGEVLMGQAPSLAIEKNDCAYVPTGGELPEGTDSVVMIENTELLGKSIAVTKAVAPGNNVIYRGDDVKPGNTILSKGTIIGPKEIGTLAACGIVTIVVRKKPRVAVLSSGDEIVEPQIVPQKNQIRDVNQAMLQAAISFAGGVSVPYGIFKDEYKPLRDALIQAANTCDMVLISGGTSVGSRDMAAKIMDELGLVLVHGIAIKPGKPTLIAKIKNTPVFGLPGHPVAAYFMFRLIVQPLMHKMMDAHSTERTLLLRLSRSIPSNHGREECVGVSINGEYAEPIAGKSGLISTLSNAAGFIRIPRDCEGLSKDALVEVYLL